MSANSSTAFPFAALVLAALALPGCPPPPSDPAPPAESAKIVTTERGPRGGRLVFLSEQGVRIAELTRTRPELTLDGNPSWSPDGAFIAFSRATGESFDAARIHIVAAAPSAEPRPLLAGSSRQRDPRWAPDGAQIVFADDGAGSFDLYRVDVRRDEAGGVRATSSPTRLTEDGGAELSPSFAPDGQTLVYMEISADGGDSRIRALDLATGESRGLTSGPLDVTPAFNPEVPRQIAYAARADGRSDMDLVLYDLDTGEQTALLGEEMADLTGPVWSIDGRHLFATAVFRSVASGEPILSSVVFIDRFSAEPTWRALHDPAFTESRIGIALAPKVLLPSLLDTNRPYREALELAIEQHLIRRE